MIKDIHKQVWAFDAEWVPDPEAGRRLYDLADDLDDRSVINEMFVRGGATAQNPTPFLKISLCRLVSVVAVIRKVGADGPSLSLHSIPNVFANSAAAEDTAEKIILQRFLSGIGKNRPQLVGYNSLSSDIRLFLQRALIQGVPVADFLARPEKPWLGPDYFAKDNPYHIDLYQILHGWGGGGPSLHQIATLSSIPGKLDTNGQMVFDLWLENRLDDIVAYNQCDALTTYLVWLRLCWISGHFTDEDYCFETSLVEELLNKLIENEKMIHLQKFQSKWQELRARCS